MGMKLYNTKDLQRSTKELLDAATTGEVIIQRGEDFFKLTNFNPFETPPSPKNAKPKTSGISGAQYDSYEKKSKPRTVRVNGGDPVKLEPGEVIAYNGESPPHIEYVRDKGEILSDIRVVEAERDEALRYNQDEAEVKRIIEDAGEKLMPLWREYKLLDERSTT